MKPLNKLIKSKIIDIKNKLTGIHAEPHQVAMGYAFGIFLAASPFIGFKVFIAIAISFIFKWNKVAAIIGVFHINLITAPVFYGFSFLVGKTVLGSDVSFDFSGPISIKTLYEIVSSNSIVFLSLLTGGIVLGLPMAIAAYFFSISLIHHKTYLKPNAL